MSKADKAKKYYEKYPDDDGRQIANMNIEGMPWYDKNKRKQAKLERRAAKHSGENSSQLEGRDLRKVVISATLICLGIAIVFSLVLVLFILFCTNIWFK